MRWLNELRATFSRYTVILLVYGRGIDMARAFSIRINSGLAAGILDGRRRSVREVQLVYLYGYGGSVYVDSDHGM